VYCLFVFVFVCEKERSCADAKALFFSLFFFGTILIAPVYVRLV